MAQSFTNKASKTVQSDFSESWSTHNSHRHETEIWILIVFENWHLGDLPSASQNVWLSWNLSQYSDSSQVSQIKNDHYAVKIMIYLTVWPDPAFYTE